MEEHGKKLRRRRRMLGKIEMDGRAWFLDTWLIRGVSGK
jgi:hypothetical protein